MSKHFKLAIIFAFLVITSFLIFFTLHKPIKLKTGRLIKKEAYIKPESISKGQIAIVLDDWGYNFKDLSLLFDIKSPITISILPDLKYSKEVAEDAKERGYQTILHLPLESKGGERPEKDTLYCSMDKNEITERLKQILSSVPGISGANNHQGSKATEDGRMMNIALSELKNADLFFLDSLTTNRSVCQKVARAIGIKYAKRDVFLDLPPSKLKNEELRVYIKGQLVKLCGIAIKRGHAIGIGHDRKVTLDVLRNVVPQLEKKGIRFVFLSELVR